MAKRLSNSVAIAAIVCYAFIYILFFAMQNTMALLLLKPVAAVMAAVFLKFFVQMTPEHAATEKSIRVTFLIWIVADIFSVINAFFFHAVNPLILNIELSLYLLVRISLLIACLKLYLALTKHYNRFQIIADVLTIVVCIATEIWLVFLNVRAEGTVMRNWMLISRGDERTIIAFLFLVNGMMIMGTLLIAWFHFQKKAMTLGQRMIMISVAGIAAIDVMLALNPPLLLGNESVDAMRIGMVILFGIGALLFNQYQHALHFLANRNDHSKYGMWENALYLLSYPLFLVVIIGFDATILLYFSYIAFYVVSCLYVKQIEVTNQLLAEEIKYNKQLKIYSDVIDQAPMSIVITDIEGNIEYVNQYFSDVTGYTPEEARGKNPRILKSEKTPSEVYTALWEKLTNGEKWEGEFININKLGQVYEERAIILPVKNESNKITNYVGIKENISESNKIRKQLSNQSYFTSQLLDTIPSAIFYVSANDIFLGANAACKSIYGVHDEEMIGMKLEHAPWMNGERYQHFVQMKQEALRQKSPCTRQVQRQTGFGTFASILYSVSPFYLADGRVGGFLAVMTDISDLKEKEEALEIALKQANEATEVKSQFLANMSHEIRTPMNAIIGMSYLALKTNLDLRQRDYINKINTAANALLRIINDVLDFSKIESGKLDLEHVAFDLDTVVADSINLMVQRAHEKQLEFLYHLPIGIPRRLSGDSLRLGQILTNLVSNAVKFTQQGEIEIDVSEVERREKEICLRFEVRDTGIDIPKEKIDKLFDAFTQSDSSTTRQFGGTGLGLTICKQLVEMMGGRIWIESIVGKGSVFSFTAWFEVQEEDHLQQQLIENEVSDMKVLIVDDNSAAREIISEYFYAMGFQANSVSTGEDALYLIAASDKANPYDAVFIDWKMPESDGIDVVRKINSLENLRHKPAMVLITAYDMNEMMKQAEGLGVSYFLAKPVNQSTLYDTIVKIGKPHTVSSDEVTKDIRDETPQYPLAGLHVLLAEDNEINQQIAYELLNGQGVAVAIAGNGDEAIEMFKHAEVVYDLILMDLQMPIKDGFTATKEIRQMNQTIPIVAMTARTMLQEKDLCYQVGMNAHIAKPINPDDLFKTLLNCVPPSRLEELTVVEANHLEADEHQIQIDGINTADGLNRVSNNLKLYEKLLRNFVSNHSDTAEKIENAIKNMQYDSVEQLSHMLRGVAGNIGAATIQTLCASMERNAKTVKDYAVLIRLNQQLKAEIHHVTQGIINDPCFNDDATVFTKENLNAGEVIGKLLQLLEEGDSDANEYFETIRQIVRERFGPQGCDQIALCINNYVYDEAIQLLKTPLEEE
ncbi:response regulator [Fusibacter paucivorans]|uniref:Stage 0 sporulation protein A homolog n=1 Tax=Fusibacter paucivorans TaxID=76009 RepID=A0ABS5PQR6_9FIRM|nr:response regulator [Fusibacter paucivorans]MBS7527505.1 response regulator [Fusibacter paucivorans]